MNIGGAVIPEHTMQGTPNFVAITPLDATVLANIRGLVIGGAGTVIAKNAAGVPITFTCVAGQTLWISPIAVMTASSATGIVAMMA